MLTHAVNSIQLVLACIPSHPAGAVWVSIIVFGAAACHVVQPPHVTLVHRDIPHRAAAASMSEQQQQRLRRWNVVFLATSQHNNDVAACSH